MHIPVSILLPIAAGIYGGFVGGYIYNKNKSSKYKVILQLTGILLVLLCIIAFLYDFEII